MNGHDKTSHGCFVFWLLTGASRLQSHDRSLGARIFTIDRYVEYLNVLYETGLCHSLANNKQLTGHQQCQDNVKP
eukprot:scaffold42326_cov38-Cyclotella_meneghiniana.AAC.2